MNIYQSMSRLYNQIKLHFKFRSESGEHCVNFEDDGKIRHHESIRDAGARLQDENLPIGRRLEAALDVGMLSYTGGYAAGTISADYMPLLVELLREEKQQLSDTHLSTLLETLCSLCYVHLHNQTCANTLGLMPALLPVLAPSSQRSVRTKMWACYLLDVLCCNNVPMLRKLERQAGVKESLEVMEAEDWSNWPQNYATILLQLLGYKPVGESAEITCNTEG